ncbi:Mg chelatase-like protein, partial [gut metagenome]
MVGGGGIPKPGEITLAHKGVLFLDELPEFSRSSLEVLRQPLESHKICISRVHGTYEFPADFLLVAAMNPCPCGFYPDRNRCSCTENEVKKYMGKISGPLLDRFDLCTEVTDIPKEVLEKKEKGKSSLEIRGQVALAQERQRKRYEGTHIRFNSGLGGKDLEQYCQVDKEGQKLLNRAYEKMELSLRAYHKIIKTARTIADLEDSET